MPDDVFGRLARAQAVAVEIKLLCEGDNVRHRQVSHDELDDIHGQAHPLWGARLRVQTPELEQLET